MTLSRRGLLAGAGLSALLAGCGSTDSRPRPTPAPAPGSARRFRYGTEHEAQYADLRLPGRSSATPLATVVLLHGGYWLPQYPAALMVPLAEQLTDLGFATWNVEYRRTGAGGGVPNTLRDVAAAVDHLAIPGVPAGLTDRVVVLGHSAGGHLAVWAASRRASTPGGAPKVPLTGAVSLSGVLDLTRAALDPRSAQPVQAFVGGPPDQVPEAYALADPSLLLPASCPVWAVHARDDEVVGLEQSTGYVAKATAAGGRASTVLVPGEHSSVIDPTAPAFSGVRRSLTDALGTT